MAVEDRTRRSIDDIKQTEVNAQLSIARALEAVRAYPDAIMIDVLRYSETARVSVQASDGKRVLASLETNTATAAITCLARLAELLLHLLDPATGRAALAGLKIGRTRHLSSAAKRRGLSRVHRNA